MFFVVFVVIIVVVKVISEGVFNKSNFKFDLKIFLLRFIKIGWYFNRFGWVVE